jgi:DNA-binding CsgD family transcriptional regulator/ligand-binding sensor domain-containing protein
MIRGILFILVMFFFAHVLHAQANIGFEQLPVQNYTRNHYKAGNQNWSIAQDNNGMIYFGNNNGLLIFNGNTWKLCPLPDQTTARSVNCDSSGRIYVGSFEEFGYFESDKFGEYHYVSLSLLLKNYNFHNEEIWKIIIYRNAVYFQSFTVIFKYEDNEIETLIPEGFITCFTKVNEKLIVNIAEKGLFELKKNRFELISDDHFFKSTEISTILPFNDSTLLIASSRAGVYLYDQNTGINLWKTDMQQSLSHDQINRGLITIDGKIILGTILNGIYVFSKSGILLQHISKRNGLQNNTVLDLFSDRNGDIWAGLDRGIDLIILNSDISFFNDFSGKIGSVYALQIKNNNLYLGTNQGLYYSHMPKDDKKPMTLDFSLINNSQGQVWNIFSSGKQLLFGHNKGTFEVEKDKIALLSDIAGGLSYEVFTQNGKEYLLGSTYTKLVVYEKLKGKWHFRNMVEDFMHPIKQIKIDYLGNIWASHFIKGLFRLKLNDSLSRVEKAEFYGKFKGFYSDYQINVSGLQNRVVFINHGKLFTFDDISDSITPFSSFEEQIGMKLKIRYIAQSDPKYSWIIADQGILRVSQTDQKWKLEKIYPFDLFYDKVLSGQEYILPLDNGDAILALDNGLAYIKSDALAIYDSISVKPVLIKVISSGKSEIELPIKQSNSKDYPSLSYWNNNLIFQYSFPLYRSTSYFLIKLQGLDTKWTKTDRPEFEYDRLPPGKYTFLIKAVDAKGFNSEAIQWTFFVKPPWYLTKFAQLFYSALIIGLIAYIRFYYRKRLQNQTRRMKIEKERELIRLRNEKLEAEIKHKSKELANTTFSIIKKNELLLEIRRMLMFHRKQSSLGQTPKFTNIVKLLDKNISTEDDWNIFESNFEKAHEEFLKRIKEQFPDLTPSDLKLCAYLRMNLSSKKIALLLGITIRGVENHRYRLRKKIGLEHDSNLIDYLMHF